jgi:flagellar basal body rod protein FlgG
MAAAAASADQLDSIADNLANAETPGYKASRPAFQSFLPPRGLAGASGPQDKVFAAVVATGTDLSLGPVRTTDNPLDVVPEGHLEPGEADYHIVARIGDDIVAEGWRTLRIGTQLQSTPSP